ncbi:hypothetical protein, partial [Candidatus Avelusimicrobium aviculae]|uniref:hypothetical protein n=1 Tax=Candidatus Avelusimicrobium aviculae TaxID=3416206 RepID=UPI003D13D685
MQKIIAVLVTISLLIGTISPSVAYAQQDAAAQRARVKSVLEEADLKAKKQRVVTVGEIRQAAQALSAPEDAPADEYQIYKTLYLEILNNLKQKALLENPAQAAQIQQAVKDWQEEAKIQEAWNTFKNSSDYQTWQKETETESRKYLSLLSSAAVIYAQKNPKAGAQLLAQTLPVFAAAGAVSPNNKQKASQILRESIKSGQKSCGGVGLISGVKARFGYDGDVKEQGAACQKVLEQVAALSVLGADGSKGSNADTEALGDLLDYGYNGVMGPAVIMTVSQGLLAMNGERELTARLVKISRQMP